MKILFFYTNTCPGCKTIHPIIEEIKAKHSVQEINADLNPKLAEHWDVRSCPTDLVIENCSIKQKYTGISRSIINNLRNLI